MEPVHTLRWSATATVTASQRSFACAAALLWEQICHGRARVSGRKETGCSEVYSAGDLRAVSVEHIKGARGLHLGCTCVLVPVKGGRPREVE
jgi:hypothetical protein